jgi:hypothetical protein
MMKTIWDERPHVYAVTQKLDKTAYKLDGDKVVERHPGLWKRGMWGWRDVNEHWNYEVDDQIVVEVYTNVESIELFQDGKSLGVRSLKDNDDRILKWLVPYRPGSIEARSAVAGIDSSYSISTAAAPARIKLYLDRTALAADRYDVAHITAQLVDPNGNPVNNDNSTLTFEVDNKLRVMGVDNGSSANIQPHQSNVITSHNGRALLIVQSKDLSGLANISVTAEGLEGETVQLMLERVQ